VVNEASFDDLMARLRAGDPDAAVQIFERFTGRLIGLARSRLDRAVRAKVDPEEVVQSVYKSFFVRFADGQFALDDWDSLWALLTVLTVRKCGHRVEYFRAARRAIDRELAPSRSADGAHASWQLIARDPCPEEAAVLTEMVEELMRTLDGPHRDIVSLSLQGHKPAEIASAIGCTERTVQRVLRRVKHWLQDRQGDNEEPRMAGTEKSSSP
jgi:RNA polymerase sigma-70 factor, ECF subfamily